MGLAELSGAILGRYRLDALLGRSEVAAVYRATQQPGDHHVAVKVLDRAMVGRSGFMRRLVSQSATVSKLGHPGIVPVYEINTAATLTYVCTRLVRGRSLKDRLASGMPVASVWRMLRAVGDALHTAHEAGVVHLDLKPGNVLIEDDGTVLVTDFGLARTYYGYARGTPGYMAPEQAAGMEVDRRADVHALALLAFEMLTGHRPYVADSDVASILSVVNDPVPSVRAVDPALPRELDAVLSRALSKDPAGRPSTMVSLLAELGQVPMGRIGSVGWRSDVGVEPAAEEWGDGRELVTLFEASLEPVVALDDSDRVTHWNHKAEELFGWQQREVVGEPVLATLVAPASRGTLQRVLDALRSGARHDPQAVEIVARRRDDRQVPLELSLSRVWLSPANSGVVAFCRDISERKEQEVLRGVQDAVADAIAESETPEELGRRALEVLCTRLGWVVAAIWLVDASTGELHCEHFWPPASAEARELAEATRRTTYPSGVGAPGIAWATGEPVHNDELSVLGDPGRELAAQRAGLRSVGGVPLMDGPEVIGALEFLDVVRGGPSAARLARVESIARRLGRHLDRRGSPTPVLRLVTGEAAAAQPHTDPATRRYRIDTRHSRLGFACAFMKFVTVHGSFRDFSGWLEMSGQDPATARAECTIKTASVDTSSLDRDYHLCSPDFFAVDRFPDMVFRSTAVEGRGSERFRLLGRLTIRDVTRPIALDVWLQERDHDPADGEFALLTASAVIDRNDWFLAWDKALEAGRWIVGEQVRLDLEIRLVERAAGLAAQSV